MYVTDYYNQRISKITISSGVINTYAGSGATGSGVGSFSGEGGAATSATLNLPYGIVLDSSG